MLTSSIVVPINLFVELVLEIEVISTFVEVYMSTSSSSSSDPPRSSRSGAGNISLGAASPGVTNREIDGISSPKGCAMETRFKIACFRRSPLGLGSADGDDGSMESVPSKRDGDGSTLFSAGAGNASGSAGVGTGSAPLNCCERMDFPRR